MKRIFLSMLIVCVVHLSGCASTKLYSSSLQDNVDITTRADSGSSFSSVNIVLDIYDVNRTCEIKFLGSVKLSETKTLVGLPVNKNSYLSFRFIGSSFMGGSSSSTSFDTLLKPRKGYEYDIHARYIKGIYNVDILEYRSIKGRKHRVESRELNQCRR